MSEDDLLVRLGALEREYDDTFPHEWEDVVRGTRTAEEAARQRRAAGDDPDEVAALAASLQPLCEAERDAWVERLAASLRAPTVERSDAPSDAPSDAEPIDAGAPAAAMAAVASLDARRRTRRAWATAAVGLLAAAALVLWLVPRPGTVPAAPDGAGPLPPFGLVVRNETVHDIRSSTQPDGAVARYRTETTIHWVLRPERSVAPPLGVRVLVESTDGATRWLVEPAGTTASERGVLELRGTLGSLLGLPPGRWTLRFVIGPALPEDVAAFDRGGPFTVVEPPYVIDVVP